MIRSSTNINRKLFVYVTAAFFVVLLSFFVYSFFTDRISLASDDGWDGEAVAQVFTSGNGTKDNPYIISSAEEFMYFKELIEGDSFSAYQDKYYKLGDDIDFNSNYITPIGVDNDKIFKGNFDGAGYSLKNFKIEEGVTIDNISYYSLFTKTVDANIYNIGLDNFFIIPNEDNKDIVVSSLIGDSSVTKDEEDKEKEKEKEEEKSQFKNIYLTRFYLDINKITNKEVIIGGLIGNSVKDVLIKNIYLNGIINNNKLDTSIGIVNGEELDKVSNIINGLEINDYSIDIKYDYIKNYYVYKDGKYYLDSKEVSYDDIVKEFNKEIDGEYYFDFLDEDYQFIKKKEDDNKSNNTNDSKEYNKFKFSVNGARANINEHASGLDGSTFYINDLVMDYNYMKGLNYTEVRNTSLPISNSGYYDDANLVKVEMVYDGQDINNSSLVGTMSPVASENGINKFVYYKYYALERNSSGALLTDSGGNNYIRVELIDNPFSKRPYVSNKEYGFNGWVCNQGDSTDTLCENSTIGFVKNNYTRFIQIPVTGGSEIVVHLNASWYEADVVTSANNITNFNSMSMQRIAEISHYTTEYAPCKAYWRQNYAVMVFSRTYVYNDGYMPRYSWYKQSSNGTTYTYISGSRTRCTRGATCYVYTADTDGILGGTEYVSGSYSFVPNFNANGNNNEITVNNYNSTYMTLTPDPNGTFWDTVQVPHYTTSMSNGDSTLGFFYQVSNPTSTMINTGEFYGSNGALCTNASSCTTAYKLIQYNDSMLKSSGGSISIIEMDNGDAIDIDRYYYLVTRDTNIFRYTSTSNLSVANISVDRPFTVTGTATNSTSVTGVLSISTNNNLTVRNDLVIENIHFTGGRAGVTNQDFGVIGNNPNINASSHNLKIGRNVSHSNSTSVVAHTVYGGTTGTFRVIVESGYYNGYYAAYTSGTFTMNESIILGSDYDRILGDNSKLKFFVGYLCTRAGTLNAGSDDVFATFVTFKSGIYGFNSDGSINTDADGAGAYLGGRGTSSNVYAVTGMKNEGATIGIILGGSGYRGTETTNSTYVGMSGGRIRQIYGGATTNTTKGNRIVNVTGGTIDYSILGGSNSNGGTGNSGGILQSDTVVYVGGNTIVGTASGTLNGVEPGCVFGAGGGAQGYSARGAVKSSHIIINGATINNGVYGGGNYGSVGTQYAGTTSAVIDIFDGTIANVYGGSKSAGFSQSNYSSSSTIDINVYDGTIGNVYGGSDDEGQVCGSVNIKIYDGDITNNVYGGGRGVSTFVAANVSVTIGDVTTNRPSIGGSVYGGSAYGTVNGLTTNATASGNTEVIVNNGIVQGNVFGGAQGSNTATPYVLGNITVTIEDGSIGKVFGGFDASGNPSAGDVVYLNGGTIGDAFGGGNNANQNTTDIRLQGSAITGNLYGGSNLLGTVTTSNVTVTSGSVTDIFGGNNLDGLTVTTNVNVSGGTIRGDIYGGGNEAEAGTSNVTVSNYTVNDVYGGGKEAGVTTTHVNINNSEADNVFGGSNVDGVVGTSNVNVNNSELDALYGGNNQGGSVTTTNVTVTSSDITDVFGGGDNATSGTSNVKINSGTITNVYGGGNEAGLTTSNVNVISGTITNVFGGSNTSGNIGTSNVILGDNSPYIVIVEVEKRAPGYYPQSNKPTYADVTVTVRNMTDEVINNWELNLTIPQAEIYSNYSNSNITVTGDNFYVNSQNRYNNSYNELAANGGEYTFTFGILSDTPLADFEVISPNPSLETVNGNIAIDNLYGGNNLGGVTNATNIDGYNGTVGTIFGGGNEASVGSCNVSLKNVTATDVYGGGNAAAVTGSTVLDIDDSTVTGNVYGGGNEGVVEGSTTVYVSNSHVQSNIFAGGNGSTAVVQTNSTVTIDGTTEVGTSSSEAPNAGCVFGSGNAASTGTSNNDNSKATVNLVGGIIHGNVYGGPKMAVVYGTTETNIGTSAVSNNSNLIEDDIIISGTVFGGGESNASGSETYDWTFISVTEGIDVNINGTGYIANNHEFIINGSVFGSGNASSSSGDSNIYIKNLGSAQYPNKSISIQRANNLVIDASVIELVGTTDRTNEYSDILYSFNMIDKLVIKNGTTLLLQHNANMLKELYSGVDSNNTLVPATVDIDDDNETTVKNVDNRIYMYPGQNLNVSINQAATAYGRVTGMTFFGMYTPYDNGTYRYGLYDRALNYGDTGNASLEIVGGSYVIGLHHANHDITKDGFYSNYLNEDYTEITQAYIDPTAIGETGYRWIIGFEAINYEFTLTASKYSSLGTYELQLIDFADGNTTFDVLGFDSSGLNPEVSLVDSTLVPRIGRTESEANNILGLSMKSETQEWTGYGTTKMLSQNNGETTGDTNYRTDSRKIPPSLMFYLYHAKNISREGRMGTTVLTLQASIPKTAIDYDIKFITVTINLVARRYDDADNYDASITYDKRYEMPSSTLVNITNESQFSAYFSLIAFNDRFENVYGNNNTNFHVLTTNNPLPVNTMITMLDFGANSNRPEYYYFTVTQAIYDASVLQQQTYNEVTYRLSNFIKMDSTSTNNKYNDSVANHLYYDDDNGLVDEEFMFIFDFKETNVSGDHLNNTMLFELRNTEDRTIYTVLGIRESLMVYNTYESSNAVLEQTITGAEEYLYYNVANDITYETEIMYDETDNRQSVIDTNYESSKMGLNISFFDSNMEPVSSSLLVGTSFIIDNHEYFAEGDGIFRIKLANKVSNLNRDASLIVNKNLPAGEYTIRYTLFASDDGLHNSVYENSVMEEFNVVVVSANNSISVSSEDLEKIVDGDIGLNLAGNNVNTYTVKYESELTNPNFRLEIFKRDISNIDSLNYTSIPFNNLFKNNLTVVSGNEVSFSMGNLEEKDFNFTLQDRENLTSGTYKLVFKLYDSNHLVDTDIKYVIVKKKLE